MRTIKHIYSTKILALLLMLISVPEIVKSQNADVRLLDALNPDNPVKSDNFFKFISNSTPVVIVGVPLSFATYSILMEDEKAFRNSLGMAGSAAINIAITYGLKYSINRKRPYDRYTSIHPKAYETSASFPSSHTSTAFATATTLTLMYPKWYVAVPSYAWASTVAYSRMHLGVHYPSDVLGGIVVGVGSAFLSFYFQKLVEQKINK